MQGLSNKQFVVAWLLGLAILMAFNYLLALPGHPQVYWLMHNGLGVVE